MPILLFEFVTNPGWCTVAHITCNYYLCYIFIATVVVKMSYRRHNLKQNQSNSVLFSLTRSLSSRTLKPNVDVGYQLSLIWQTNPVCSIIIGLLELLAKKSTTSTSRSLPLQKDMFKFHVSLWPWSRKKIVFMEAYSCSSSFFFWTFFFHFRDFLSWYIPATFTGDFFFNAVLAWFSPAPHLGSYSRCWLSRPGWFSSVTDQIRRPHE